MLGIWEVDDAIRELRKQGKDPDAIIVKDESLFHDILDSWRKRSAHQSTCDGTYRGIPVRMVVEDLEWLFKYMKNDVWVIDSKQLLNDGAVNIAKA